MDIPFYDPNNAQSMLSHLSMIGKEEDLKTALSKMPLVDKVNLYHTTGAILPIPSVVTDADKAKLSADVDSLLVPYIAQYRRSQAIY